MIATKCKDKEGLLTFETSSVRWGTGRTFIFWFIAADDVR